jgi:hypothetical protein
VDDYLSQWLAVATNRSGPSSTPEIHITECNANQHDEAARPTFFENLASWLNKNVIGGNPHLLTFFPQHGGPHSVSWGPPRQSTVQALQQIQKGTFG